MFIISAFWCTVVNLNCSNYDQSPERKSLAQRCTKTFLAKLECNDPPVRVGHIIQNIIIVRADSNISNVQNFKNLNWKPQICFNSLKCICRPAGDISNSVFPSFQSEVIFTYYLQQKDIFKMTQFQTLSPFRARSYYFVEV